MAVYLGSPKREVNKVEDRSDIGIRDLEDICCQCGKGKVHSFSWSEPLRRCTKCYRSYHLDCHVPTLDTRTPENIICGTCERLDRAMERSAKRPRRLQAEKMRIATYKEPSSITTIQAADKTQSQNFVDMLASTPNAYSLPSSSKTNTILTEGDFDTQVNFTRKEKNLAVPILSQHGQTEKLNLDRKLRDAARKTGDKKSRRMQREIDALRYRLNDILDQEAELKSIKKSRANLEEDLASKTEEIANLKHEGVVNRSRIEELLKSLNSNKLESNHPRDTRKGTSRKFIKLLTKYEGALAEKDSEINCLKLALEECQNEHEMILAAAERDEVNESQNTNREGLSETEPLPSAALEAKIFRLESKVAELSQENETLRYLQDHGRDVQTLSPAMQDVISFTKQMKFDQIRTRIRSRPRMKATHKEMAIQATVDSRRPTPHISKHRLGATNVQNVLQVAGGYAEKQPMVTVKAGSGSSEATTVEESPEDMSLDDTEEDKDSETDSDYEDSGQDDTDIDELLQPPKGQVAAKYLEQYLEVPLDAVPVTNKFEPYGWGMQSSTKHINKRGIPKRTPIFPIGRKFDL